VTLLAGQTALWLGLAAGSCSYSPRLRRRACRARIDRGRDEAERPSRSGSRWRLGAERRALRRERAGGAAADDRRHHRVQPA